MGISLAAPDRKGNADNFFAILDGLVDSKISFFESGGHGCMYWRT